MTDNIMTGLKLLLITAIATFALALTQMITEEPIRIQAERASNEARAVVLESADEFAELDVSEKTYPNIMEAHEGRMGNNITGYTFKTVSRGYGGDVIVIVGIDEGGNLSGVRIVQQSETPGLGARVGEPGFYEQYRGISAENQIEGSALSAVSGATVSSNAVTNAVNYAIDYYQAELADGGGN
ncbi:MAG: RnfABCDGE type electron transport complex subunit G [Clostridia bacterium]|nr:RnfABCDGE type electron transport complex subunit G [Clostridia bacterium]